MVQFFTDYNVVISGITNIFIALGTVGAVITALYLSRKDHSLKLKVYTDVAITLPDGTEYLRLTCINLGNQSVVCTGFSIAPNMKMPKRIMPVNCLEHISNQIPCRIGYSEKLERCYDESFFSDPNLRKFLSQHKWLAAIELKLFWRIIAHTNYTPFLGMFALMFLKCRVSCCKKLLNWGCEFA